MHNTLVPSSIIETQGPGGREISAYLPPWDRQHGQFRVPVIYAHDGNNLFDPKKAFLGRHWKVRETLDAMILQGLVPPLAVIGIHNTPNRMSEYSPVVSRQGGGGQGRQYLFWILNELVPWATQNLPVSNLRNDVGMVGSSMGGLISLYASFWHADRISRFGIMSPSLKWADHHALKRFLPRQHHKRVRLWMDIGLLEGLDPAELESVDVTRFAAQQLLDMGYVSGQDFCYCEQADAAHDEYAWAERFPWMIAWLFSRH